MQSQYAIKNGELIEAGKACVSVYNKSLFFDFAVYSNIKVVNGTMFFPDLEIRKLFESASLINLSHSFTEAEVMEWAQQLIGKNNLVNALIRLLLIGPEQDLEPVLFLFPVGLTFYPRALYKEGAKFITYHGERYFPTAKTKSLLLSYLAYREAVNQNALDALLVDADGTIREGTRSSFFVIRKDTLIVPPKEKVLEGATRAVILKIAPQVLKIKEADIMFKKIKEYDECFVSSTSLNIMPVKKIDEIVLRESVGEKVKALQKLFQEYCRPS